MLIIEEKCGVSTVQRQERKKRLFLCSCTRGSAHISSSACVCSQSCGGELEGFLLCFFLIFVTF